jgi:ParB family chromosome partitioning protein
MGKQAIDDGKRLNAFAVDPGKLTIVGYDTDDGPEHPLYDKRVKLPVDENLAKDMLLNGFRGAIEVRRNGDKLEVVFGRQRVKAARKVNEWAKERNLEPVLVSCFVKKGTDAAMFGVRIGENIHRKGLGLLDMADELRRYLDMGRTEEDAAVTFGMTKTNVKNLMRLNDLDGQVRKAVEDEELSPSAAAALAELSREEQREELIKLLAAAARGEKPTRKAAKKAVNKRTTGAEKTAPPKRQITLLLKLDKKNGGVLNADVVRGILWALGDIGSASIKGMRDLEREIEGMTVEKAARKAERKKAREARETKKAAEAA